MEISPLPHKAPFVVTTQVEATPEMTPMEDDTSASMEVMQDMLSDNVKQPAPPE